MTRALLSTSHSACRTGRGGRLADQAADVAFSQGLPHLFLTSPHVSKDVCDRTPSGKEICLRNNMDQWGSSNTFSQTYIWPLKNKFILSAIVWKGKTPSAIKSSYSNSMEIRGGRLVYQDTLRKLVSGTQCSVKGNFKVTEFSKQPRDVHIEPTLVQQSDFLWTRPAWTVSCVTGIHQAPFPEPPHSGCLTMPLFSRIFLSCNCSVFILFPKVTPIFFTFKPSQALLPLSLWEI